MGAVGLTLNVSGEGDHAALHTAIWDAALDLIYRYTPSSAAVNEYLSEAPYDAADAGIWGDQGGELIWFFKDYAGCCSRSSGLWLHWFERVLAADWAHFTHLAAEHDLTITSPPPVLTELLADRARYVRLRDDVWSVDEHGLYGDDKHLPLDDLTADEQERHAEARERCMCGMCQLLRPDPAVAASLLDALDHDSAASAAWYLARTRASPEIITALVRAGDNMMRPLVEDVERYASRVPGVWPTLIGLLPDLRGGALGLAFYALAATSPDDADRAVLLRHLRTALAGADPATEAAAELVGRIGRGVPELPEELAVVLDREVSDEVRHSVVLGLVNLHLPGRRTPSPAIAARLEREATRDTEAGRLAQWMLSLGVPTAG
ncbi:hypothetical protein AB0I61_07700 [Polymorphospora rubra]|uniref:hypothetical protein n=1 Tax=Polymorphospora rubra TaxID=338584 RepID=UPI0033E5067C